MTAASGQTLSFRAAEFERTPIPSEDRCIAVLGPMHDLLGQERIFVVPLISVFACRDAGPNEPLFHRGDRRHKLRRVVNPPLCL